MKILVVCGAGASSTFVAQRVRHAAQNQGLAYSAFAGTELSLPIDLDAADVVLVGPHLAHALERIERVAAARGTGDRPRAVLNREVTELMYRIHERLIREIDPTRLTADLFEAVPTLQCGLEVCADDVSEEPEDF